MKNFIILLIALLVANCAHDPSCERACTALQKVKPDKEGYLPRDQVFQAVGLTESDVSPFLLTDSGGHTYLDCGCFFEFINRGYPKPLTRKTIDEIINNPNRRASTVPRQLESAVIVKKDKEICRVESAARRKEISEIEAKDHAPVR